MKISVSLTTLLFVVFLILKLCGVIAWSWWWVFSPLWIPIGLIILVLLTLGILGLATFRRF